MGLILVTRCDTGWPTGRSVSLIATVVGATVMAPAGTVAAVTPPPVGGGLGSGPLGTAPLGA